MQIKIDNYKNIGHLEYEIIDNSINFLIGISGSGKSSIGQALVNEDPIFNKKVDADNDPVILLDGKVPVYNEVLIFNQERCNWYLSDEKNTNEHVFNVFVDDDNQYQKVRLGLNDAIASLKQELERCQEISNALTDLGSLGSLNKDNEFKKTSKIKKIRDEYHSQSNKKILEQIANMGSDKYNWIINGKSYIHDDLCPYCEQKLSQERIDQIHELSVFDGKAVKALEGATEKLQKVKLNIQPNSKGLDDLYDGLKRGIIANRMFADIADVVREIDNGNILIKNIKKFSVDDSFYYFFPSLKDPIEKFNKSIGDVKHTYSIMINKTKRILSRRLKKINDSIRKLGIPYQITAEYKNKVIDNYKLILDRDASEDDRKRSLSNGERSLVSLIMFLQACRAYESKKLIIIDDPVSSFDEYRRQGIYDILKEMTEELTCTMLVLSHDSVFAKFAVKGRRRSRRSKLVGKIDYIDNLSSNLKVTPINEDDFNSLDYYVKNRIRSITDYFQTIINLRVLYENNPRSNKYRYLSCILHSILNNDVSALEEVNENEIIAEINNDIGEKKTTLIPYSRDLVENIDVSHYCLFEKCALMRELLELQDVKNQINRNGLSWRYYKNEMSNMIHLNSKLYIGLDPYKFNLCSSQTVELINANQSLFDNLNDVLKHNA